MAYKNGSDLVRHAWEGRHDVVGIDGRLSARERALRKMKLFMLAVYDTH